MEAGEAVEGLHAGLGREGPDIAIVAIGNIEEFAVAVADHVHFPAGEDVVLCIIEPGEAAAVLTDHEAVATGADDVDPGHGGHGVGDAIGTAIVFEVAELVGQGGRGSAGHDRNR